MKKNKKILGGIALILVGIIWTTNIIGLTSINIFFPGWWTLFLILPGGFNLLFEKDNKTTNLFILILGIMLFLASNGLISFITTISLIFPTILIIIGINLIFPNIAKDKIRKKITNVDILNTASHKYTASFASSKQKVDKEIKNVELSAAFGEIEIDFTNAIIEKETYINAKSIFGKIEMYLPKDVNVEILSTSLFGDIKDKRRIGDTKQDKTIYIDAESIFGEVVIYG